MAPKKRSKPITVAEARAIINDRIQMASMRPLLSQESWAGLEREIKLVSENRILRAAIDDIQRQEQTEVRRVASPPPCRDLREVIRESILHAPGSVIPVQHPPFTLWERFCNWLSGC